MCHLWKSRELCKWLTRELRACARCIPSLHPVSVLTIAWSSQRYKTSHQVGRDMVPSPVICWHDIVMWHECKCSSTQHLPWLSHWDQFNFPNTQYILFREILACFLQKADGINCLTLANLYPIPLPRFTEITRHKTRVTSWPVWCFEHGRDGPTCILSRIVTTYIYSSEQESRRTHQVTP